ncbi:MAG: PIN domain-containing protein, partial [Mycobacteriales bacterium]
MIVCDANALYASYDKSEPQHKAVLAALTSASREPKLLSPFVLAELDYFMLTRLGTSAENALLRDVEDGVYQLCPISTNDVTQARALINRYEALKIGIADASIAVLAARHQTTRILTFDARYFRAITPLWGDAFTLL